MSGGVDFSAIRRHIRSAWEPNQVDLAALKATLDAASSMLANPLQIPAKSAADEQAVLSKRLKLTDSHQALQLRDDASVRAVLDFSRGTGLNERSAAGLLLQASHVAEPPSRELSAERSALWRMGQLYFDARHSQLLALGDLARLFAAVAVSLEQYSSADADMQSAKEVATVVRTAMLELLKAGLVTNVCTRIRDLCALPVVTEEISRHVADEVSLLARVLFFVSERAALTQEEVVAMVDASLQTCTQDTTQFAHAAFVLLLALARAVDCRADLAKSDSTDRVRSVVSREGMLCDNPFGTPQARQQLSQQIISLCEARWHSARHLCSFALLVCDTRLADTIAGTPVHLNRNALPSLVSLSEDFLQQASLSQPPEVWSHLAFAAGDLVLDLVTRYMGGDAPPLVSLVNSVFGDSPRERTRQRRRSQFFGYSGAPTTTSEDESAFGQKQKEAQKQQQCLQQSMALRCVTALLDCLGQAALLSPDLAYYAMLGAPQMTRTALTSLLRHVDRRANFEHDSPLFVPYVRLLTRLMQSQPAPAQLSARGANALLFANDEDARDFRGMYDVPHEEEDVLDNMDAVAASQARLQVAREVVALLEQSRHLRIENILRVLRVCVDTFGGGDDTLMALRQRQARQQELQKHAPPPRSLAYVAHDRIVRALPTSSAMPIGFFADARTRPVELEDTGVKDMDESEVQYVSSLLELLATLCRHRWARDHILRVRRDSLQVLLDMLACRVPCELRALTWDAVRALVSQQPYLSQVDADDDDVVNNARQLWNYLRDSRLLPPVLLTRDLPPDEARAVAAAQGGLLSEVLVVEQHAHHIALAVSRLVRQLCRVDMHGLSQAREFLPLLRHVFRQSLEWSFTRTVSGKPQVSFLEQRWPMLSACLDVFVRLASMRLVLEEEVQELRRGSNLNLTGVSNASAERTHGNATLSTLGNTSTVGGGGNATTLSTVGAMTLGTVAAGNAAAAASGVVEQAAALASDARQLLVLLHRRSRFRSTLLEVMRRALRVLYGDEIRMQHRPRSVRVVEAVLRRGLRLLTLAVETENELVSLSSSRTCLSQHLLQDSSLVVSLVALVGHEDARLHSDASRLLAALAQRAGARLSACFLDARVTSALAKRMAAAASARTQLRLLQLLIDGLRRVADDQAGGSDSSMQDDYDGESEATSTTALTYSADSNVSLVLLGFSGTGRLRLQRSRCQLLDAVLQVLTRRSGQEDVLYRNVNVGMADGGDSGVTSAPDAVAEAASELLCRLLQSAHAAPAVLAYMNAHLDVSGGADGVASGMQSGADADDSSGGVLVCLLRRARTRQQKAWLLRCVALQLSLYPRQSLSAVRALLRHDVLLHTFSELCRVSTQELRANAPSVQQVLRQAGVDTTQMPVPTQGGLVDVQGLHSRLARLAASPQPISQETVQHIVQTAVAQNEAARGTAAALALFRGWRWLAHAVLRTRCASDTELKSDLVEAAFGLCRKALGELARDDDECLWTHVRLGHTLSAQLAASALHAIRRARGSTQWPSLLDMAARAVECARDDDTRASLMLCVGAVLQRLDVSATDVAPALLRRDGLLLRAAREQALHGAVPHRVVASAMLTRLLAAGPLVRAETLRHLCQSQCLRELLDTLRMRDASWLACINATNIERSNGDLYHGEAVLHLLLALAQSEDGARALAQHEVPRVLADMQCLASPSIVAHSARARSLVLLLPAVRLVTALARQLPAHHALQRQAATFLASKASSLQRLAGESAEVAAVVIGMLGALAQSPCCRLDTQSDALWDMLRQLWSAVCMQMKRISSAPADADKTTAGSFPDSMSDDAENTRSALRHMLVTLRVLLLRQLPGHSTEAHVSADVHMHQNGSVLGGGRGALLTRPFFEPTLRGGTWDLDTTTSLDAVVQLTRACLNDCSAALREYTRLLREPVRALPEPTAASRQDTSRGVLQLLHTRAQQEHQAATRLAEQRSLRVRQIAANLRKMSCAWFAVEHLLLLLLVHLRLYLDDSAAALRLGVAADDQAREALRTKAASQLAPLFASATSLGSELNAAVAGAGGAGAPAEFDSVLESSLQQQHLDEQREHFDRDLVRRMSESVQQLLRAQVPNTSSTAAAGEASAELLPAALGVPLLA